MQKYPNCTFISVYDAYPYLANRYQIKQFAVVEIFKDQLSPTDVQKEINAVKQYKAKAILGESGFASSHINGNFTAKVRNRSRRFA